MNKHYSRKSIKFCKKKQEYVVFEPFPHTALPVQQGKDSTKTGAVKYTGLFFLQPEVRGFSFREEETCHFHHAPS